MSILQEAVKLHDEGASFCLAVVVAKSGSAPQVPGAKGIFLPDGRIVGTIGGGCLEMECRRLGLEALATRKHLIREFQLDDDFGWDDGLICGGRVQVLLLPDPGSYADAFRVATDQTSRGAIVYDLESGHANFIQESESADPIVLKAIAHRREALEERCFVEPSLPPEKLVVFGGGHIGRELCRIGADLGFEVTVIDDRPEFVNETRMMFAHHRICQKPEVYARDFVSDQDTYLCLVTRGHRNDARVIRELIHKDRAYLGMIGSKRKREMVRKGLIEEGVCTDEEFANVLSPMGVDIGAETVEEIAISIAAEWIQVRAAKRGPILARCGQKVKQT